MKFGLFVMPCHDHRGNPTLAFEQDLNLIEFAESIGFDEVFTGEHHSGGWENIPAPDLFISAAAQRTSRIRLGTGVIILPYHDPFLVAERMAFLDHLSHGRVILGVGGGGLATDIKLLGFDRAKFPAMTDEALDMILRLLREDGPITQEGQFWTLKDAELQIKPYQDPLPVAYSSVGSPHSIDVIAKYDLLMLSGNFRRGIQADELRETWGKVEAKAAEYGREMSRDQWRATNYVYLSDTPERALAEIEHGFRNEFQGYWFNLGWNEQYEDHKGQAPSEIMMEQVLRKTGWMVGDPDQCVRWLEGINEQTGGLGGLIITSSADWARREDWYHSLELFAKYVIPEFKRSNRGTKRAFDRLVEDTAAGTLPQPPR